MTDEQIAAIARGQPMSLDQFAEQVLWPKMLELGRDIRFELAMQFYLQEQG